MRYAYQRERPRLIESTGQRLASAPVDTDVYFEIVDGEGMEVVLSRQDEGHRFSDVKRELGRIEYILAAPTRVLKVDFHCTRRSCRPHGSSRTHVLPVDSTP